MKNNKSFNKILELTETALATPEIKKDKNLCEILEKIKDSAAKGEFYYDIICQIKRDKTFHLRNSKKLLMVFGNLVIF